MAIYEQTVEECKSYQPKWGPLGLITYIRTYSRFLPGLGRRELWGETVKRVVDCSADLGPMNDLEKAKLYKGIYDLKVFPAGRTLWAGGTNAGGSSHFNCTFMRMDKLKAFSDMTYLLMVGAGTGFSVEQEHIHKLPRMYPTRVEHRGYTWNKSYEPNTLAIEDADVVYIVVGDSKEGWAKAVLEYLKALSEPETYMIVLEYDNIRPRGERLQTFGGRASGPEALQMLFDRILHVVERRAQGYHKKLGAVDVTDICNAIAAAIIAGGVRRSAQIALGGAGATEFITMKDDLYTDPDKARYQETRTLSNNSIMFKRKPSRKTLMRIFDSILKQGEPGIINVEAAEKRRDNYAGTNPCGEQLLADRGACNLVEIVLPGFIQEGRFNLKELMEHVQLITRHACRITNATMFSEEWDYVQKRDRLLGVSITGYGTAATMTSQEEIAQAIKLVRKVANSTACTYLESMGAPSPVLVTSIKPSGTLSLLPGVSPGCHSEYAPKYIRRIRINSGDPLCKALTELGLPSLPENGQSEEKHDTRVFSFPVKTKASSYAYNEPALIQLERYKFLMEHYVDNNCSITVTFEKSEVPDIVKWLSTNWDTYVAIAFLPKFDPMASPYPQMPYEPAKELPEPVSISEATLNSLISLYEVEADEYALEASCDTGSCPVR